VQNNPAVSSSDRSFYSSRKKPAPREPRRQNGHKAQLALSTQLQNRESQLEKLSRKLEKSQQAVTRAQEQLLAQTVKLRSCEAALEEHENFLSRIEAGLGLKQTVGSRLSVELRQQAILDALASRK
jgi:chromosome segregation ATPase